MTKPPAEPDRAPDAEGSPPEGPSGGAKEEGAPAGAAGPSAASVFVTDPEGLPKAMDSPFWEALPRWEEFRPVAGSAPVKPSTEFRVAHDARRLAFHVRCEEPKLDSVWTRRTSEVGRLDLDDSVEILLDPYGGGFRWSLRATPAGEFETVIPVGAVADLQLRAEVRVSKQAWEVLIFVPFVDVGLEGDLRGTPLDGESWGLAVVRRRREAASGGSAGLREVAAWAAAPASDRRGKAAARDEGPGSGEVGDTPLARLVFQGGRERPPFEFTRYAAGGFGVNEICVGFPKNAIPPGVEVSLSPKPSAKLRSKDVSRYKFRVARPGLYRYSIGIPYQPPPEPTEEEIAEYERELGRELTEEELARKLEERTGTPEHVAGLSFLLRDVWAGLEEMEDAADRMREELDRAGIEIKKETGKLLDRLEKSLNEADRFRAPHAKGRLGPEHTEKLAQDYANVREAVRGALLEKGKLSVASPYLPSDSAEWHLGALRVRTTHSVGTEAPASLAAKLKRAGLSFCAFADLAEGGDQDGDGKHDWNGDGEVAGKAHRIKGTRRAVREDRGREAYVRDYSRTAADQGKRWVKEDWKLSVPGEFVVLRASETGAHFPALCLGLPPGALPPGAFERYEAVDLAQRTGGLAVMCGAPGDLRALPPELVRVMGIDAPQDAWERLLATGRRIHLFPGTGLGVGEDELPERAMIVGVLAEELSEEAILAALRRGSFYVTTATGPRITGIDVRGDTVVVRTSEPCQIFFRGAREGEGDKGAPLAGAFGQEAKYRFTGREKYVRAVALSDVLEDGFRLEAVTQPFYLADSLPSLPEGLADPGWTVAEPVDRSMEPEEETEGEPEEEPEEEPEAESGEEPGEEAGDEPGDEAGDEFPEGADDEAEGEAEGEVEESAEADEQSGSEEPGGADEGDRGREAEAQGSADETQTDGGEGAVEAGEEEDTEESDEP